METSIVDSSEVSYRNSGVSDTLEHLLAECQDDVYRHLPEMRRSNRKFRLRNLLAPETVRSCFENGIEVEMSDVGARLRIVRPLRYVN